MHVDPSLQALYRIQIRFFAFLIGNDITQVEAVDKMACTNRGLSVYISNFADIQEKVHVVTLKSRIFNLDVVEFFYFFSICLEIYRSHEPTSGTTQSKQSHMDWSLF